MITPKLQFSLTTGHQCYYYYTFSPLPQQLTGLWFGKNCGAKNLGKLANFAKCYREKFHKLASSPLVKIDTHPVCQKKKILNVLKSLEILQASSIFRI
jgi:hypothetical protein